MKLFSIYTSGETTKLPQIAWSIESSKKLFSAIIKQ